jgi:hypothetical protein
MTGLGSSEAIGTREVGGQGRLLQSMVEEAGEDGRLVSVRVQPRGPVDTVYGSLGHEGSTDDPVGAPAVMLDSRPGRLRPAYQSRWSATNRNASPSRAMRPADGSGKCAVHTRVSVSQ